MSKENGLLNKWELNHLQELIYHYASDYYPDDKYTLIKDGSLERYHKRPKWWAKAINKVEKVDFLKLIRFIYRRMTNDKSDDIGFAKMFLESKESDIIEVLFLLHIYAKNAMHQECLKSPQNENFVGYEMGEPLINCLDGLYKFTAVPVYSLYKDGISSPGIQNLYQTVIDRMKRN